MPPATTGEQWVLVRLHGDPLGILKTPPDGLGPLDLQRAIAKEFHWRLSRHLVADALCGSGIGVLPSKLPAACPRRRPDADLPLMTVAVCTRDRAAYLAGCLDALMALDYPADRLELLLIDNAPSDDRTEATVRGSFPGVRYVREPRPGLDWARNRAVLESRGRLIAFTDDDVSVDAGWARAIARVFAEEPDAMAVTGLVVPDETDVEPQLLFERYGGFGRGFDRRYYRVDLEGGELAAPRHGGSGRFGTGASMAFRRELFDAVGLFDPALDVGTVTNGGGDLEMFFRVLKHGHMLVYEPAAMVRHRHRREYAALKTQLANNGVGFYAYLVRTAGAYPEERQALLRLGVWWFWWWNMRRLARSVAQPRRFPMGLVVAEIVGSVKGLRRYPRARGDAKRIAARFGPHARSTDGERAS